MTDPIIAAENLTKHYMLTSAGFSSRTGVVHALEKVSLAIMPGEVFGLVGESGCGKSTLGRVLLRLEEPTSGKSIFEGEDLAGFGPERLKKFRRQAQIIYQDPYSALNPRKRVGKTIEEALEIHKIGTPAERAQRVTELLSTVGLRPEHAKRYPHEFSGGQRQRIVIARALALNPRLILADEPVSALDVSIQAQVINLLEKLKADFGLTYLFISHDLSVVEHMADRVGVMYLGRMVELADKKDFYAEALHPYSQALLSAAPVPDPTKERSRIILTGDVPSPINPPPGCAFHPRCPRAMDICREKRPELKEIQKGRRVSCHLHSNS
ncbi:ABC transporter ATP-binding protein [Dethiosulfatarculus sandiegensis]|uniref:ABC transporter ATP-binding protein n=1 Tax=Dethiosulfatarculus sandiegensis TaxID=1429043 RepID=UPI0005C8428A|nr:dipeptide ABC transporter ATP-binding protein [Dethiosulfatarculus sandiegensis]